MRIELRKTGLPVCPTCGSHELMFVPALNEHLERDLLELFNQKVSWWRFLKRRRYAYFTSEIERVTGELRSSTRFPIS